jgi:hypothetical protein
MLKTQMRKFLLLLAMPPAFLLFWITLIFAKKAQVDQVWQLVEQLKHANTGN